MFRAVTGKQLKRCAQTEPTDPDWVQSNQTRGIIPYLILAPIDILCQALAISKGCHVVIERLFHILDDACMHASH